MTFRLLALPIRAISSPFQGGWGGRGLGAGGTSEKKKAERGGKRGKANTTNFSLVPNYREPGIG